MSDYHLELTRMGLNKDKSINGYLRVYRDDELIGVFSTMERGAGFVHLRVGVYEMKHSRKGKGRRVRCLRPTEERIKTILIHDAVSRKPTSLAGCIAPLFIGSEAHSISSADAMEALWNMLGGYKRDEAGKNPVKLIVLTNATEEDALTKETWTWDYRNKHH